LPEKKWFSNYTINSLIPNKLGYTRNETQSKNITLKISNINDNNEDDEIIIIIILLLLNK
jgi:hypothetical protein